MTNRSIRIPILNDEYKVIVRWGTDSYTRKLGKKYHYDVDTVIPDDCRGITFTGFQKFPLIILRGYPKEPAEFGTLAHEAYHAVSFILAAIHEPNCEEIIGHSIGAIVRSVLSSK